MSTPPTAATAPAAAVRRAAERPAPVSRPRHLLERLFPSGPARPLGALRVLAGTVVILAGAALSLLRTRGPGPFNSIWAEDATDFLSDSLNKRVWTAVLTPFNGYYHVLPRLLTEVAKQFGIAWMPGVMTIEAALVVSALALIVYVASAAHLTGVPARLLVCVPLVVGPIYGSVPNNVATLQFSLVYGAFWMLLWAPVRRRSQLVAVAVLVAAAASTILAAVLLPLALLRLYGRRDRASLVAVGAFLLALAVQVVPHVLGLTPRGEISRPRFAPLWALREYVLWALPREVLGQRWGGPGQGTYTWVVVVGWAVLLCAVLAAALRLTRPDWLLAGVSYAFSVLMFTVALMLHGSVQFRYALSSGLILLVTLAALLVPRPDRPRLVASAPVAAALAVLLLAGAVNFRISDYRDSTYPWNDLVRRAAAQCRANAHRSPVTLLTGRVGPWHAVIPCRYLNG